MNPLQFHTADTMARLFRSVSPSRAFAHLRLLFLLPFLAVFTAAVARAATDEIPTTEFHVPGDFDGDGRIDIALVDASSGVIRVAYQTAPGAHAWAATRSSGVHDVTGATAGRLLHLNRDALAITTPAANRLFVIDLPNSGSPAIPSTLYPSGLGPSFIAAVNLPGPGDTGFDDWVVASVLNGAKPHQIERSRNANGTSLTLIDSSTPDAPVIHVQRVRRSAAFSGFSVAHLALNNSRVRIYNATVNPVQLAWTVENLPAHGGHFITSFSGGQNHHLITWNPGGNRVSGALLTPGNPAPPTQEWTLNYQGIQQIHLVEFPDASPLLLATLPAPELARLLRFDGTNTWVELASLPPPEQGAVTGASGLADGGILLFGGSSGRSTQFQKISRNGTSFTAGPWSGLPRLPGSVGGGNVLEFASEPFVSPAPHLLRSRSIPDWTSGLVLGAGPPSLQVAAESFQGSQPGLDTPVVSDLGAPHPSTQAGLVNQYHSAISIYSFSPAYGDTVSEVTIRPGSGRYKTSVSFSFTLANPLHQVRYQLDGQGDWVIYTGTPVPLVRNTTVRFFAQPPLGGAKSAIQTAHYEFTRPIETLDSNGDGLPDFVALGKKLDPHSDGDSDDDGVSDLRELLASTDPLDPTSKPASDPVQESAAGRRITLRPRPVEYPSGASTVASTGTVVRIYNLGGAMLGAAPIQNPPVVSGTNSARLPGIQVDPEVPLLVAATDPHYRIHTSGPDLNAGSEIVALLTPSPPPQEEIGFVYHNISWDFPTAADAWIAAVNNDVDPPLQTLAQPQDIGPLNTLSAILAEAWMAGALLARGYPEATNLTLFPFRTDDTTRWNPGTAVIRSLFQPLSAPLGQVPSPPSAGPPFIPPLPVLDARLLSVHPFVPHTNAAGIALRNLAFAIYTQSARASTASVMKPSPGSLQFVHYYDTSPVPVFRQFVWTGTLDPELIQTLGIPFPQLALAFQGVLETLANAPAAAPTELTVRVRPQTFDGACATLELVDSAESLVSLFDVAGTRYRFPETFDLPPGTTLAVQGFVLSTTSACPGQGVEVTSARVVSLPPPSLVDINGNLLPDAWEWFHLGNLAPGPFSDSDQDGYPDFQELLEGSDPADPGNKPAQVPLALEEPELEMNLNPSGEIEVKTKNASALLQSPRLGVAWDLVEYASVNGSPVLLASRTADADGRFRVTLPSPREDARFYRVQLRLVRR